MSFSAVFPTDFVFFCGFLFLTIFPLFYCLFTKVARGTQKMFQESNSTYKGKKNIFICVHYSIVPTMKNQTNSTLSHSSYILLYIFYYYPALQVSFSICEYNLRCLFTDVGIRIWLINYFCLNWLIYPGFIYPDHLLLFSSACFPGTDFMFSSGSLIKHWTVLEVTMPMRCH